MSAMQADWPRWLLVGLLVLAVLVLIPFGWMACAMLFGFGSMGGSMGPGMMGGGMGMGWGWLIGTLLLIGLLVAVILVLLRALLGRSRAEPDRPDASPAADVTRSRPP